MFTTTKEHTFSFVCCFTHSGTRLWVLIVINSRDGIQNTIIDSETDLSVFGPCEGQTGVNHGMDLAQPWP